MKQANVVLPAYEEESTAIDAGCTRWLNVKSLVAMPPRSKESTAIDAGIGVELLEKFTRKGVIKPGSERVA